ncbi:MAG: hypothetical protein JKY61_03555, partial [Planctomycetes bacterium]|nr:hypothetical protein [Planctomycetota bacterium]
MKFIQLILMAWALCVPVLASSTEVEASDAGATVYRTGDYKQAQALWLGALEGLEGQPGKERQVGQLCYNLGNAAYRAGESMQAIAWYTAARKHMPRDADLLANLKFVRGELALPPEH